MECEALVELHRRCLCPVGLTTEAAPEERMFVAIRCNRGTNRNRFQKGSSRRQTALDQFAKREEGTKEEQGCATLDSNIPGPLDSVGLLPLKDGHERMSPT